MEKQDVLNELSTKLKVGEIEFGEIYKFVRQVEKEIKEYYYSGKSKETLEAMSDAEYEFDIGSIMRRLNTRDWSWKEKVGDNV